jgi:uncharacterized membrane protein
MHDGMVDVSELIVLAFTDEFRAPEVLNELRRRDWDWVVDLNEAMAVTLDGKGGAKVQLSVDLAASEGAAWARLWGSLLGATLFLPATDVIVEAAGRVADAAGVSLKAAHGSHSAPPEASWWKCCLRLPEDFMRDVGASVGPGDSAVFMLSRAPNRSAVLRQLRNYGGTLLHTSLDSTQDEQMQAALALR